jgi:hypothetical protein
VRRGAGGQRLRPSHRHILKRVTVARRPVPISEGLADHQGVARVVLDHQHVGRVVPAHVTSSPLEDQRSFTASGGYSSFVVDVELVRADEHLVGTVGDQRVELVLDIPNSRAGIRGESLGAPVGGYWRIESNFNNLDSVGLFLGEYDGRPVHLRSDVRLTPHYAVRHADVSGAVGEQELRGYVAPVEAPAYGPTVMSIDGDFDGAAITLLVTVATDLSEAHINGVIGGHTISIDATLSSVSGQYDGPAGLFPLLVSCLLYFI